MRHITRPPSRCFTTLATLLLSLLAGCAGDEPLRESDRLLAAGRPEEALRRLEAAARANPQQAAVYNAFMTQRHALVSAYTRDADALRARGELDNAEAQYRHALRLDPVAEAPRAGLGALERERRLDALAAQAAAALRDGDAAAAERLAREVLQEQPAQRGARAVMKALADVQARAAGGGGEPRLKAALGRTVSLELRDAALKSVFDLLSREGEISFVLDKEVRTDARATLVVRDTNLDDVIKLLLLTHQLERRVLNDHTLLVFPATAAKLREYQELVTRTFYLANADAKQTSAMIRAMVKTRDIFIDEKLNLVMIRDTPEAVRLAEQLVAAQDLPEPEVMLEVEVLEVASTLVRDLGVNFPGQVSVGPAGSYLGSDGGSASSLVQLGQGRLRGFVANPLLLLNLRQEDGVSNLLANPRIRVKNREKAKVHIGERVPVITTTSTANVGVSSSVSYLETGLKLDVEPNVHLDDEVAIKVQLEVSNILAQLNTSGTISYRLGTRNAATTLRLKDGETQVLAGLINNEDRRSVARVPLLGEVPVFGRLFRNDSDQNAKSEIVLLITPRIVRNVMRPAAAAAAFPSGTEAVPGAAPLRLVSGPSARLGLEGQAGVVPAAPPPAASAAAASAPASAPTRP
jgi:general secretion pathway protein D